MRFYADLHVHSKFSRATSRDCDLENLALWARKKGVLVVGTGDFTHPGWFGEIEEKLVPAEPGLFRLRPDLEAQVDTELGVPGGEPTRFMLQVEISTIYKRDERTRKVHHLLYAPDLERAKTITESLARIGNLKSDGRPILGLDSRDLLEITLDAGDGCYLVPAHVWTPWFAVLGSKSGFDTIDHCYGDLSREIFAIETGLSSDPEMNRRLSALDRFTLVSSSDAHSPPKIGREACVFDCELDYFFMKRALETREGYAGTIELFPEEGKYHHDGHRKCGVSLRPEETRAHGGTCPACGKGLTLGVLYRVDELADRDPASPDTPPTPYRSLIPLDEVLAEIQGYGPQSKSVRRLREAVTARVGPELFVLESAHLEDIERAASPVLAEALSRMREGRVIRKAGFDGEYGTIRLFEKDELERKTCVPSLLELLGLPAAVPTHPVASSSRASSDSGSPSATPSAESPAAGPTFPGVLDPAQQAAVAIVDGPLVIVAGPGTGKTRTLTHRIAHLVLDREVRPESCLAITFTRRAATEMVGRLEGLLGDVARRIAVMTFHSFGLSVLETYRSLVGLHAAPRVVGGDELVELLRDGLSVPDREARRLVDRLSMRNRRGTESPAEDEDSGLASAREWCERRFREDGIVSFEDLIERPLRLLRSNSSVVDELRSRYLHVSVDEGQDMDRAQYELVRFLVPPEGNLCVIGDPDQSIYGFRGGDVRCLERLLVDYSSARRVVLGTNYRSTRQIVDASCQMIRPETLVADRRLEAVSQGSRLIEIHECVTDRAEAELVVHAIERAIGGSAFFSMDSGRVESSEGEALSFGDFAVLYRTKAQADLLAEAFARSGMPFRVHSHESLIDCPGVSTVLRAMDEIRRSMTVETTVPELLEPAVLAVRGQASEIDRSLESLRALAARHRLDYARFRSELSLGVDVDLWDPRAEAVALLTLHASKGLEFPVVFIVGCEDGLLPFRLPDGSGDSGEERRLFFVGMTRAKRRLVLTRARRRVWRGATRTLAPSPFLETIARELQEAHEHRSMRKPTSKYRQLTFFDEAQP